MVFWVGKDLNLGKSGKMSGKLGVFVPGVPWRRSLGQIGENEGVCSWQHLRSVWGVWDSVQIHCGMVWVGNNLNLGQFGEMSGKFEVFVPGYT